MPRSLFSNSINAYGKDKSEVARTALQSLQGSSELKRLQESAELYAQLYAEDPDIAALAEVALSKWPK